MHLKHMKYFMSHSNLSCGAQLFYRFNPLYVQGLNVKKLRKLMNIGIPRYLQNNLKCRTFEQITIKFLSSWSERNRNMIFWNG
jgi:hypothetical protein